MSLPPIRPATSSTTSFPLPRPPPMTPWRLLQLRRDQCAPGCARRNIYSTFVATDSFYFTDSGTSLAAPYVSGALALMLAEYPGESYHQNHQPPLERHRSIAFAGGQMRHRRPAELAKGAHPDSPDGSCGDGQRPVPTAFVRHHEPHLRHPGFNQPGQLVPLVTNTTSVPALLISPTPSPRTARDGSTARSLFTVRRPLLCA